MQRLLFLMMILIVMQGCFPEARRGSLSDAMDKASDDYEGERRVAGVTDDDDEDDEYYEEDYEDEFFVESSHGGTPHKDSARWISVFSITGGNGKLAGGDFTRLKHVTLGFGWLDNKNMLGELNAGLKWSSLHETSDLQKSLQNGVAMASIGADFKVFATPPHTFIGQYFMFGASYNYMFWSYKNAIYADDFNENGNYVGTERIDSDGLSGLDLYMGTGINIFHNEDAQIGFEVQPGIMLWFPYTTEGFRNDIFDPFPYIQFKFTIHFLNRKTGEKKGM